MYRSPTSEVRKGEDNRLIVASYEMGPLDKPDDYYATLEIKPLEVIYQKHFIDRIRNNLQYYFVTNIILQLHLYVTLHLKLLKILKLQSLIN